MNNFYKINLLRSDENYSQNDRYLPSSISGFRIQIFRGLLFVEVLSTMTYSTGLIVKRKNSF